MAIAPIAEPATAPIGPSLPPRVPPAIPPTILGADDINASTEKTFAASGSSYNDLATSYSSENICAPDLPDALSDFNVSSKFPSVAESYMPLSPRKKSSAG